MRIPWILKGKLNLKAITAQIPGLWDWECFSSCPDSDGSHSKPMQLQLSCSEEGYELWDPDVEKPFNNMYKNKASKRMTN